MEPQVSQLSQVLLLALLATSVLAVPRKDCRLERSNTGGGQCFSEPECEQKCQTVQDRQCQTNTEQVTGGWGGALTY